MDLMETVNKNRHTTTLIAMLVTGLLSGGISWHYLIIPTVLFMCSIVINIRNIKFNCKSILITAILLSGILSLFFTNADKQNTIHEFMKIIIFVLAFYVGTATNKRTILNAISLLGTVIAVLGILGYCNIVRINEFVFNDRTFYRLQSFIKYANITAVMLGCTYFALVDIYEETTKQYIPYVSAGILIALYLTISKAAIPLFLLIGILGAIFEKKYAKYFLLQNFICLLFAAVIIFLARKHYYSISFLTVVACIAITGTISKNSLNFYMDLRKILLVVLLILIAGIAGVLIYTKNTDIFATLISRFVYSKDALQILKSNWFLGIGAGGWKYYQYGVQSMGYNVNYIHNGLIQFWLDYGFIGLMAFIAIFADSVIFAFRKKEYTLLCIILLIATHSIIDIDFSFGIILVIYGLIIGYLTNDSKQFTCYKPFAAVALAISLLFMCYSCGEYIIRNKFEKAYLKKDYQTALQYAYKLEKICPSDSSLKESIAALDSDTTKENLKKAVELSPLDKDIFLTYINYLIDNGYKINITNMSEHFISLAPKQESTYAEIQIFAKKAFENGLCSIEEYDNTIADSEQRRKEEHVVNRNELLNEIAK